MTITDPHPAMPLTASIIGREAIRILLNERRSPTKQAIGPQSSFAMKEPRRGIFYENVALFGDSLSLCLDDFSERFIWPAMRRLALRTSGIALGAEYMELPKGVDDAANDHFDGLAIRTLIDLKWPLRGQKGLWSRKAKYYDIQTDSIETGPCGIAVVFTVHEPGLEAYRLQIPSGKTSASAA